MPGQPGSGADAAGLGPEVGEGAGAVCMAFVECNGELDAKISVYSPIDS